MTWDAVPKQWWLSKLQQTPAFSVHCMAGLKKEFGGLDLQLRQINSIKYFIPVELDLFELR